MELSLSHSPNITLNNPIPWEGKHKSYSKAKSLFKLNTFDLSLVNTTFISNKLITTVDTNAGLGAPQHMSSLPLPQTLLTSSSLPPTPKSKRLVWVLQINEGIVINFDSQVQFTMER